MDKVSGSGVYLYGRESISYVRMSRSDRKRIGCKDGRKEREAGVKRFYTRKASMRML